VVEDSPVDVDAGMTAEIVAIHDGPSLMDIVGQLRAFADRIEAGEYGEVDSVIALVPRGSAYPRVLQWGDNTNLNDPIIQLELAKFWLLMHMVERT
jgi:hypothetical protein